MIYRLDEDYESCLSLLIENGELGKKMPHYRPKFRAEPRADQWVDPVASFYESQSYLGADQQLPDVSIWTRSLLVLNPKAYEVFKAPLCSSGEFLPILVEDEQYYLFNTLYVVPDEALQLGNAVDKIDTGVHFGKRNVGFDEALLGDHMVFKTKTDKLLYSYCTEAFKVLYTEHGFSGLVFKGDV